MKKLYYNIFSFSNKLYFKYKYLILIILEVNYLRKECALYVYRQSCWNHR